MSRIDLIRERLASLDPQQIELEDESALHVGHPGARDGGGHFRLFIVADAFAGKGRLARHRMVYAALGDMMQQEIHALAIQAHTPEENAQSSQEENP